MRLYFFTRNKSNIVREISSKEESSHLKDINSHSSSNILLKACIFATGLAGIVAEYVMCTLASYLLGNTVLQWTITVSLMLFAMGLGSRMSKYIKSDLLDAFIIIEFTLSIICAVSAGFVYFINAYTHNIAIIIYTIAILIGLLIGLEIPLATRLNNLFEELRINISSVMEKDYYGALLGGLLFAFIALPYLGLTYTPIILGMINFIVAAVLFLKFRKYLQFRRILYTGLFTIPLLISILFIIAEPIILFGEQHKYVDRIIYQEQTPYQRIVITQWKQNFWLYLNGNEQFSSYDEDRYHEPLVHPAMKLAVSRRFILILGGGDGLAVREVLKYPDVEKIFVIDIDPAITRLARNHPLFMKINRNAMNNEKVTVINKDAYLFLQQTEYLYDIIIIDLPDPKTVDLARLYSKQFYQLAAHHLSNGGVMVTQASSPFFAKKAFLSIYKTVLASGLKAVAYQNNIPTMGQWGWVIGMKRKDHSDRDVKAQLLELQFNDIETHFINIDAMYHMLHFGKGLFDQIDKIKINDEIDLMLYNYYKEGNWDFY